jgi:hypothetical protein
MATKRSKKQTPSQYPSPFSKAPPAIEPLLPQLNPASVYITHIDRHPPPYKKQIFTFAVIVNTTITLLLLWRLYVAVPKYIALVQALLGYASTASVDPAKTTRQEQLWILFRRFVMLGMDYAIIQFVVPWPMSFFLEQPANPVTWRWKLGFLPQEVVVRVSRNWGEKELLKGSKVAAESPYWKTRIEPAIAMEFLRKTGYLMMDANFDLDFGVMQDAHYLVKEGKMKWDDLDRVVLVHSDGGGWLAYRFGTEGDRVEENRKKMMAFRDLLQGMGKESLFWKWQEIVEEERERDGEVTEETKRRIAERVGGVFEKEGVDFKEAMESVGEVEALPVGAS